VAKANVKGRFIKEVIALLALIFCFAPQMAMAQEMGCGGKTEPCQIAEGSYNVALPENWAGGPAVLHLHGFGGSGAKVIGNTGFAANITKRGYALIAPTGQLFDEDKPNSRDWGVDDGAQYARDDIRFINAVLDDAAVRFGFDRDRVLVSGFSRGGSMVWDLACSAPDTARAYAPASGGFWAPFPAKCEGPVKLFHTHGFKDKTVPLEGRPAVFGGVNYTQSDIYQGLQRWRQANGCGSRATDHVIEGVIWRKIWGDCDPGAALEFALHPGGHGLPKGWSGMVLDWFEAFDAKP
jgi:polyhydroxybutyrate depolymerase